MRQSDLEKELEKLVDATGLQSIVEGLSRICHEKAEHIRSSYNDKPLARLWEKNGNLFGKFSSKIYK